MKKVRSEKIMSLILSKENYNKLNDKEKELYNLIDNTIDEYLKKESENKC